MTKTAARTVLTATPTLDGVPTLDEVTDTIHRLIERDDYDAEITLGAFILDGFVTNRGTHWVGITHASIRRVIRFGSGTTTNGWYLNVGEVPAGDADAVRAFYEEAVANLTAGVHAG